MFTNLKITNADHDVTQIPSSHQPCD